jgi:diacylglycerol kinase family enzyme
VTVRDLRFVRILQLVAAALRSADQLAKVRGVQVWPDVERLTIIGHGAFPYQVDGDFIGDVERLDIRYVPDALRLVRPLG